MVTLGMLRTGSLQTFFSSETTLHILNIVLAVRSKYFGGNVRILAAISDNKLEFLVKISPGNVAADI